jgi:hypothetical protein
VGEAVGPRPSTRQGEQRQQHHQRQRQEEEEEEDRQLLAHRASMAGEDGAEGPATPGAAAAGVGTAAAAGAGTAAAEGPVAVGGEGEAAGMVGGAVVQAAAAVRVAAVAIDSLLVYQDQSCC